MKTSVDPDPGKGLTSWLSFVMFNCVFVTFPCDILGQAWCLAVSIPDLCHLSYFHQKLKHVLRFEKKGYIHSERVFFGALSSLSIILLRRESWLLYFLALCLSMFCVSSSRCRGLVCMIVVFPCHSYLLFLKILRSL